MACFNKQSISCKRNVNAVRRRNNIFRFARIMLTSWPMLLYNYYDISYIINMIKRIDRRYSMDNKLYKAYVSILEEELLPAMGCTEPIAVAYASALARKTLGALPDRVKVCVSANIIKNVKSVIVPHTGGQRGIEAAVAAGIVAGDADAELEVLSNVTEQDIAAMKDYLNKAEIRVEQSTSGFIFDIQILASKAAHSAFVQIALKYGGQAYIGIKPKPHEQRAKADSRSPRLFLHYNKTNGKRRGQHARHHINGS